MKDNRTPPMIDLTLSLPNLHGSLSPPTPPRRRCDPIAPTVGDDFRPDPVRHPGECLFFLTLAAIIFWVALITAFLFSGPSPQ